MPAPSKTTIALISQKVKDIKIPPSLSAMGTTVANLRKFLHRYSFIPGDKFTGVLTPVRLEADGTLLAELSGSSLSSDSFGGVRPNIDLRLDVGLQNYTGPLNVESIFSSVAGAAVSDGGNVQNMLINMCTLLDALALDGTLQRPDIIVASSSDPFERYSGNHTGLDRFVKYFKLDIEDRYSIQLPWFESEACSGTLVITSEPERTQYALTNLLSGNSVFRSLFRQAICFASADPAFDTIRHYGEPPYLHVINASTAFRALVAVTSYGTDALLPMNQGEAGQVCKLLLSRGQGTDLDQTETPRFPSPLSLHSLGIDRDALRVLDETLDKYTRYNLLHRPARGLSFVCPISFGAEGGLIVGADAMNIACFTSIPSEEGQKRILAEFCDLDHLGLDQIHDVGAGDAVAAVITLFNTVDPHLLLQPRASERGRRHVMLMTLACTVFVGILSRLVGELLLRTKETYLANISSKSLSRAIDITARQSMELAESLVKQLPNEGWAEVPEWGIHVVVWQLGYIAYPGDVRSMLSP